MRALTKNSLLANLKGQILIIAIVFMAVVLILSATLFAKVGNFLKFGSISIQQEQAISLAEAGVDKTLWFMNKNGDCDSSCADEVTFGSVGTFKVQVSTDPQNPNQRLIVSTGYIPNSTNPKEKRTVKITAAVDTTQYAFHYAAQTGDGGLLMNQSSWIEGNIYSNGSISAGSGSGQTITGDAYAVGTIGSGILIQGTPHPGSPKSKFPEVDYNYWKNAATSNPSSQTIDCSATPALCNISSSTSIGYKKYIGNLTLSNNAIVTMNGPIWVTGDFTMTQGGTTLQLDSSFGSNSTVIIIDGVASLNQGGQFTPTNANPPGYIMLVTTSTSSDSIDLSQSGATAIFYALNGGVNLSQTADVMALVAKQLTMSNSATLHYSTGLAGANFSAGPGGAWVIKKGTYKQTSSP